MFAQLPGHADAGFDFPLCFVQVVGPLGSVSQIQGPLPISMPLTQNQPLFHLRLVAGKAWLQVKRQTQLVLRRVNVGNAAVIDGDDGVGRGHEGEVVEVMQGLSPGERVVVENAYLLKSEFERVRFADPD